MVGVCVELWHNMDIVCREPSHYIIVPRPKYFGRAHNDVMMTDPFFPQLVLSMACFVG